MSLKLPPEPRPHDVIEAARGAMRCRIPQRLPPGRTRPSSITRGRVSNHPDVTRQKYEGNTAPSSRFSAKINTIARFEEGRPKSANRLKDEILSNKQGHNAPRSARGYERTSHVPKRPSTLPRRAAEIKARPIIMVPKNTLRQHAASSKVNTKKSYYRQDQEAKKQHENLALRNSEVSAENFTVSPVGHEYSERESITSRSEQLMKLKITWQDKVVKFEKMKVDLRDRQKKVLEVYAAMRETHEKLTAMGESSNFPPSEELRIMNVSKMSPEQLLQLCTDGGLQDKQYKNGNSALTIDINRLYAMPAKLLDTCEKTLAKRQEIMDWFESLKTKEKGVNFGMLARKINEFKAENDMLKCTLDQVKPKLLKDLEEIIDVFRKGVNETMALQVRSEELTYELSEMNNQNTDLRKQIHNADHVRSHTNRIRIEELEKELKEEKLKRLVMRDRLARSDGMAKMNGERATQLEATLEQARSQIWSLERTVQQKHEQSQKLQSDFDKEFNNLTECIKEHTMHLEEIAEAREKLQLEKENLEKQLAELSTYYNESLKNVKQEITINVSKLIESENKYEEIREEKKRLEDKLESLCEQILEIEVRHKDTLDQLHEKNLLLEKERETNSEFVAVKQELVKANLKINEYGNQITKLNEFIQEIEGNLKISIESEESLRCDLCDKKEYVVELEKKHELLEQQLQENENKMEVYVEQLSSLKEHINQLQEDFGEYENVKELQETVSQQRKKLQDMTRQTGELTEALQKKEDELEQYNESLTQHEKLLLERETIIKMLSDKEEEQGKIINILKNNLELRSQVDNNLNQQLMEKDTEIESLLVNLETRKQQISNMEKIILTLEDQTRKASLQKKKDQDHIVLLQKKITEYESMHVEVTRNVKSPTEDLDSLIKGLEDEFEDDLGNISCNPFFMASKKKYLGERKSEFHEDRIPQTRPDTYQTKVIMGSYMKKPCDDLQYTKDIDRKKAITSIDTQKWNPTPELGLNVYAPPLPKDNLVNLRRLSSPNKQFFTRNLQCLNPADQLREEKTYRMLKLAGHKL